VVPDVIHCRCLISFDGVTFTGAGSYTTVG